jgi:putative flippase GtrA
MSFVRRRFGQLARYSTVSLISTAVSMIVLGALVWTRTVTAGWANVIATAVGTIPSFELNRRWVWQAGGRPRLGSQIVPFTVLSFAGLGLSTWAVRLADVFVRHAGWSNASRTAAVELASNAAFGALWVLQFVLLDRLLFPAAPPPDVGGSDQRAELDPEGHRLVTA